MPFVITTNTGCDDAECSPRCRNRKVSRRGVLALEDRRAADGHIDAGGRTSVYMQVINAYGGTGRDDASPEETEHLYQAANIPESGGTVGPLPDGTLIEVEPRDRDWLETWSPHPIPKQLSMSALIAAYNAREGQDG